MFDVLFAASVLVAHAPAPRPHAAAVTIDSAWVTQRNVRWTNTREWVAHMHVRRPRGGTMRLVGASSPLFTKVELWQWGYGDGLDVMTPTKDWKFWRNDCLDFTPAGKNLVVLRGPTQRLALGARVPVTLRFSDGGEATFTATYATTGPASAPDH